MMAEENIHGEREISDPIHGMIPLSPVINFLMDQPEFQRLRDVHQLGVTFFVYPSASHNRFQHCIGTYHMARTWLKTLQRHPPLYSEHGSGLTITQLDIDCVCVAALYHDLGHGPFSHFWDNVFIKRRALAEGEVMDVSHEAIGIRVLRQMWTRPEFEVTMREKFGMDRLLCLPIIEAYILGDLSSVRST